MTRNFLLLAVLALLVSPSNLCAQSSQSKRAQTSQSKSAPTLHSVIRKGSNTTYFELLRMLLPDLQFDSDDSNSATAHRTIPVRHIAALGNSKLPHGPDNEAEILQGSGNEAESLLGDFAVTTFGARWLTSNGRQILLLHLDLPAEGANEGTPYEGEATLLAAFSVDPTPKVLDVMDTKTDRFTDFWEAQPVFQLNSQNEAFVVYSTHFNAGESYNDLQLLFLDGERFKIITSIFLLNTQGCAATFNETPHFRAALDSRKYPKIIVRVKVKKERDARECSRKTPGYTKYYQGVFYWHGARQEYQSNSPQLNTLAKFNRARL